MRVHATDGDGDGLGRVAPVVGSPVGARPVLGGEDVGEGGAVEDEEVVDVVGGGVGGCIVDRA